MKKEIIQLQKHKTWLPKIILRSSLPSETQIVSLTWVLKIKRRPNGELVKFKARLCYRGNLDKEPHPSFSPVTKWTTILSVLEFALNNNFATKQIDFSNAFVQEVLPDNMNKYTDIPNAKGYGMKSNNHLCMKLHKSLYVMIEAPSVWFKAL